MLGFLFLIAGFVLLIAGSIILFLSSLPRPIKRKIMQWMGLTVLLVILLIVFFVFVNPWLQSDKTWHSMKTSIKEDLWEIWGSSASDVFAIGDSGTLLHYDGQSWNSVDIGTTNGLGGIWGSSASDIFAVGLSGTVLHYDGQS